MNRLTAASDSSGWSRQFGYDAWGNTWVTANSGVNLGFTLAYDAENRQVSATEQPNLGKSQELYIGFLTWARPRFL